MNKRRIIFTGIVGTIALAALSVSLTLAWYGASDRLSVSNLDVHVFSSADLRVNTTDDINSFKPSLNMNDFDERYRELLFIPTSSMYQGEWFDAESDTQVEKPTFYDIYTDNLLTSSDGEPKINKSTTGFFSEDVYFLTNFDQYITLEVLSDSEDNPSTFLSNTIANRERANDLYSKYGEEWGLNSDEIFARLNSLIDCLRVSILVLDENQYSYYIIDPTKQAGDKTLYGGVLDTNGDGYYDTYRPEVDGVRVDTEVVYGEVNNRELIDYDLYHEEPVSGNDSSREQDSSSYNRDHTFFGNCFDAKHKNGSRIYDAEDSKTNGFEIVEEPSLSLYDIKESNENTTEVEDESRVLKIPCYANKPSHIVLSIYLEGWDLDCVNATMGASFDITLNFKLLRGI